ncbi:MAG: hypothetical protein HWN66_22390 [Candidatus Helarchaeota archaeon]|nr:hypothetical protein [Candidatus Helarchaeota archaeon]
MVFPGYRPRDAQDAAAVRPDLAEPQDLLHGVLRLRVPARNPAGLRRFGIRPDGIHPWLGLGRW